MHLFFVATLLKTLLSFFFKELDECLLLNLILNVALAEPGITLSAELSILILVTSRFVAWKSFVPLSNLISFNFFKIFIIVFDGLFALWDKLHDPVYQ